MNESAIFFVISAIGVAVLSTLVNFTGRRKYKDDTAFFKSSNEELRAQNADLRTENTDLRTELATAKAANEEKDRTIRTLQPFTEVVRTMSDNHKAVMKNLTGLTKIITGKLDGRE